MTGAGVCCSFMTREQWRRSRLRHRSLACPPASLRAGSGRSAPAARRRGARRDASGPAGAAGRHHAAAAGAAVAAGPAAATPVATGAPTGGVVTPAGVSIAVQERRAGVIRGVALEDGARPRPGSLGVDRDRTLPARATIGVRAALTFRGVVLEVPVVILVLLHGVGGDGDRVPRVRVLVVVADGDLARRPPCAPALPRRRLRRLASTSPNARPAAPASSPSAPRRVAPLPRARISASNRSLSTAAPFLRSRRGTLAPSGSATTAPAGPGTLGPASQRQRLESERVPDAWPAEVAAFYADWSMCQEDD